MKRFLLRALVLLLPAGGTMWLCLWLHAEHDWFGGGMGPAFLLLWPSVIVSRLGLLHTWLFPAVLAPVLLLTLAWCFRRRSWGLAPLIGVVCAVVYCLAGRIVFLSLPAPLPQATPYDDDSTQRAEYLETYAEGYGYGISGVLQTYCFAPEHTTQGFYDGMYAGGRIFNRVIGRQEASPREKRVIRAWAGVDGARADPTKTSVEQSVGGDSDKAADGLTGAPQR